MAGARWRTSRSIALAVVAAVLGLIGVLVVIVLDERDRGGVALTRASVDEATLPVSVPFREVAGAIVIDVAIGEAGDTVPMILDTGAPTIVAESIAEMFAGDSRGSVATTSADGQVTTSAVVMIPGLSVGGATFRNVGAVVDSIAPGDPFHCITDAGFLGTSVLRTAIWRIDPRSMELTIASSLEQLPAMDGAMRLDFERDSETSPSPLISLDADAAELRFLIDTGSDGWMTAHPDDVASTGVGPRVDPPARSILAHGSAGPFATRVEWGVLDVALGPKAISLPVAMSDALEPGRGNIGTDFLARFVVTIDWLDDALYLEPIDGIAAPSAPMTATLGWDDGFVIGSFIEGREDTADLKLGVPVGAIDGRDVSAATFDDYCRELSQPARTRTLKAGGAVLATVEAAPAPDFFDGLDRSGPSDGMRPK